MVERNLTVEEILMEIKTRRNDMNERSLEADKEEYEKIQNAVYALESLSDWIMIKYMNPL